jgi:O-antigen ligase
MSSTSATIHNPDAAFDSNVVTASSTFVLMAALVITTAFLFPFKQSWTMSVDAVYTTIFVSYGEKDASEDGWTRSAALIGLGLFGLMSLVWPGGRPLRAHGPLILIGAAYMSSSALSCALADEPTASLKRFAGDVCGMFLACGIAKRISPRQFVALVFACTLSWVGIGLAAELSQRTLRPWEADYRFAGIMHPNSMGVVCAFLIISALHLRKHQPRYPQLLLSAAFVAFVLLVLTRSRTSLITMLLVMALPSLVRTIRRNVALSVVIGACVALTTIIVIEIDLIKTINVSVFGRPVQDDLLSNRDALWWDLLNFVDERPLFGYGYGFWSVDLGLSEPAQSAHSTYVDLLVHFGFVGAILYVMGMVLALARAALFASRKAEPAYVFIAMLLTYVLLRGATESVIGFTHFTSLFAACGVSYFAFREGKEPLFAPSAKSRRSTSSLSYRNRLGSHPQ